MSLFAELAAPHPDCRYIADAFAPGEADAIFAALRDGVDWRQESIFIAGQMRLVPRLVAWHGDAGARYRYSGVTHEPRPWTPLLAELRDRARALAGARFNSVLLNHYRDGADGMGWHADDEPELGPAPVIASLSFGAPRRFCFRRKPGLAPARFEIALGHGSCLVMRGDSQRDWLHALPKTKRPVGPRINLTFRVIVPA